MKVHVNKGVECCIEIQFGDISHAITSEEAWQLVSELDKALEEVPAESVELMKDFWWRI